MKLVSSLKVPALRLWLLYFVLSVGLVAMVLITVQQSYRQNANDPQVQMAEDTATALDHGQLVASLVPAQKVSLRTSLAPFLIVLDDSLNVVASSGELDGQTVVPPKGAFEAARNNVGKDTAQRQENRITWQPSDQVRMAAVIVHHNGGYVVAARSLREVENREDQLTQMISAAFVGLLLAGLVLLLIIK